MRALETHVIYLFAILLNRLLSEPSEGCRELLSHSNGTISTPGYPRPYSENLDCAWEIRVNTSSNLRVQLRFVAFETAGKMPDCSDGDYIEIRIGCTTYSLGRFCNRIVLPVFYSLDNCMTVVFHSNRQSSGHGFKAYYSSAHALSAVSDINSGCGVSVFEKEHSGNIFTPLWPQHHPHYINCLWRVTVQENRNVKFFFTDFELKQCSQSDYLDIRTGANTYLNSRSLTGIDDKCDSNTPFQVVLSVSTIHIKFESTGVGRRRGFMAGFVTFPKEMEEKFDPKVLILLALIFGSLIVLGAKTYITILLRRKKTNQQSKTSQEPPQSSQQQSRFKTTGQRLNRYFSTRRGKPSPNKKGRRVVFANSPEVTQSQSHFFLLPQSSTSSDILSFAQPVTDAGPSTRPLSGSSERQLAWTSNAEQKDGMTTTKREEGQCDDQ